MTRITDRIAIDTEEIKKIFLRAGGPGGQNVNKVASAVQLRFDAGKSPSLEEATRARLRRIAGRLMTAEGRDRHYGAPLSHTPPQSRRRL